jgi:hypothetical protein
VKLFSSSPCFAPKYHSRQQRNTSALIDMQLYSQEELQNAHESFFIHRRKPPPTVLPPAISPEPFGKILEDLSSAVGHENVVTGANLVNFVDLFSSDQDHVPSAAVWCD